jgi:hypothetical protein
MELRVVTVPASALHSRRTRSSHSGSEGGSFPQPCYQVYTPNCSAHQHTDASQPSRRGTPAGLVAFQRGGDCVLSSVTAPPTSVQSLTPGSSACLLQYRVGVL